MVKSVRKGGKEMSQMLEAGGLTANNSTVSVRDLTIRTTVDLKTKWFSVKASAKSGFIRTALTSRSNKSKLTNSKISHSFVDFVKKMVSFLIKFSLSQ